ncbi:hypothetical protein NZK35_01020 [Stieleria sp. ICT_E10.1]|uniref:hypothetical protein n=1 Tax=Stieleria sedimenti TaxID=2976331 RepID=UPI00217F3046|nr:hypothetical protein [Stieleria sedimenti]MCS7465250.1 hypothetical protein [Stieleria sedimenti]
MIQRNVDPVLHRLQRALETGASREEVAEALAAAESAAEQSGEEFSPLLRYRAEEYVQAERMLERRRLMFAVACVVCLFATVVGAFGLTTLDRMRTLVDHEAEFDKLVVAEAWDEASNFLDQLDEDTRSEPAFVRGREMVDQAITREAERKAEFKRLADQMRSSATTDIDADDVKRLNTLARSDEERQFASEMLAKVEEQRLQREAARANDQTHAFETLQDKVERFLRVESDELDEDGRAARRFELQQELGRFAADHQLGNPELSEAAKQAAKMLAASAQQEKKQTDRDKRVQAITRSVGNAQRYRRAIQEFVDDWPRDALAQRLQRDAPGADAIDATLAWIDVLSHPAYQQPQSVDGELAKAWLATLEHAESLEPGHPLSIPATRWRATYQTLADCDEAIQELRAAFRSPLVHRIYVYPDPSGSVFYSEQAPDRQSPRAHLVSVLLDLSLERETKNFGLRFREEVLPKVALSGHSQFAAKMVPSVTDVTVTDFTPVAYRLISELRTFQSEPEFDPIYRLIWMRRVLEIAVRGSVPIKLAFGDWLESLQSSGFDWDTNWLASEPEDVDRLVKVTQARRLLEGVDDWNHRVERMLAEFKAFRSPRPPAPRWIGWVSLDGENYEAVLSEPTDSHPLVVFPVDPQTGQTKRVDIGALQTSMALRVTDPDAQQCGAILCVVSPRSVASTPSTTRK